MQKKKKSCALLKISNKLPISSTILKDNCYLAILFSSANHTVENIMDKIKLNDGYVTVFFKSNRSTGLFAADF